MAATLRAERIAARERERLEEARTFMNAYSPHTDANVRYPRARAMDADGGVPKMIDLHGQKTYDDLRASRGSTLVYEYQTLYPASSYLFDGLVDLENAIDGLPAGDVSQMARSLVRGYNTCRAVLSELLVKRLGVLQATAVAMSTNNPIDKAVGELARERGRGYADNAMLLDPSMESDIGDLREQAARARLKALATAAGSNGLGGAPPGPPRPNPNPNPKTLLKPNPNPNPNPRDKK